MSQAGSKKRNRTAGVVIGVIVGLVAIAVLVYLADIMLSKDRIPRGTAVGGVSISSMSRQEALSTLETNLGGDLSRPVTVTAGEAHTQIDPATSGLGIDWDATVAAVPGQSYNPVTRLMSLFRETEVPIVSTVDVAAFGPRLDAAVTELHRDPVNGTVRIDAGTVATQDSVNGQSVDRAELESDITDNWLNPEGIEVEPTVIPAAISQDRVDEVAAGPAAKAVSAPFVIRGRDNVEGTIPVERMGEVVTFPEQDGDIRVDINRGAAVGILSEALAGTEQKPRNAQISFASGSRVVTPEVNGSEIDWDATLADAEAGITGNGPREVDAAYVDTPATFTTADAEAATFDQVMGEFTTGGFSAASGTNIGLTARMVDGAVVAPGDTFSLNGYTGPRGSAQGFVDSGIILNGHADTAVGGGISQFATTLYNAYYFAGLEDIAHTPHSYYISRYPAGREATVYEGAIDLKFRNDTPYPVMIRANADSSNVTVQIMGVKTRSVQSINNGRWAQTDPKPMTVSGDSCSPSGGAPGFTTSDTRVISDASGGEIRRETTTTVYDPSPIVRCS
ncbi:VanW family protein [Corynebacterium pacaense]|uniref:VanW family protein n=1 Tax=Corynebacterium pacaense TaxID=1816684 RepID=UPI003CCBD23A